MRRASPWPASLSVLGVCMMMIEIAQTDPLQGIDRPSRDLVAADHHEGGQHGQHHESERGRIGRLGRYMVVGDAGLDHHERELADLRQIDRRQEARAQALLHQIERREGGEQPAYDREGGNQESEPDHGQIGQRDGHAERHEEQRDEEIAQRGDLGRDIERIREGRERDARDQRPHLTRQRQPLGGLGHQEAPGERTEQDQLRRQAIWWNRRGRI